MPRFVRYDADCAICCSERTDGSFGSFDRPMKLPKGMAGMYWPKVPFAVTLNVRLEAKVVRAFGAPRDVAVATDTCEVSGRISSVPIALEDAPLNHVPMTVSRAIGLAGTNSVVGW